MKHGFLPARRRSATLSALLVALLAAPAQAIYVFGSDVRNTTAPTGALADSGWQYVGDVYGGGNYQLNFPVGVAFPVAPNWFLQSWHIARPTDWPIVFDGEVFNVQEIVRSPLPPDGRGSDLALVRVDRPVSRWAPLYTGSDEVGKDLVIVGAGSIILDPDSPMFNQTDGRQVGWYWKQSDRQVAWGTNRVNSIAPGRFEDYLYFTFDQPTLDDGSPNPWYAGPNEAGVAPTDSGAGIFIQEDGVWKLAGLLYGVDGGYDFDGVLQQPGGYYDPFWGAVYDARGMYQLMQDEQGNESLEFVTGDTPRPMGMYGSRVSSELDWIARTTGYDVRQLPPGVSAAPEPSPLGYVAGAGLLSLGLTRWRRPGKR